MCGTLCWLETLQLDSWVLRPKSSQQKGTQDRPTTHGARNIESSCCCVRRESPPIETISIVDARFGAVVTGALEGYYDGLISIFPRIICRPYSAEDDGPHQCVRWLRGYTSSSLIRHPGVGLK